MDCPNCGAYNASNSYRCRRCNHVLPTEDDSTHGDSDWSPASGPEERWEEHFRKDPESDSGSDESVDSGTDDEWASPPESEPARPSDWEIAQPSSSQWETGPTRESPTYGTTTGVGDVPNYLWPSIAATLCCCAPLGIPAIIYASRVDAFMTSGERAAAEEASNKAKMFALAALGVAILFWIAIFCTGVFTGDTAISTG
jgi:hypothetical protein